jgi:hypothetical protein
MTKSSVENLFIFLKKKIKKTLIRTSPHFGGATSTRSNVNGLFGSQAIAALQLIVYKIFHYYG